MRRLFLLALLAGMVCAGCGDAPAGQVPEDQMPSARAAVAEVAGGQCPQQEPPYVANQGKGLDGTLVPVIPDKLIVCRYDGLNEPRPLALAGERTLTDSTSVTSWRKRFNALPKLGSGRFNCPNDDESAVLAGFLGHRSTATVVRVALRGCQFASNGAISRSAGGSGTFLTDLSHLAP
jgi:hypothetical protein